MKVTETRVENVTAAERKTSLCFREFAGSLFASSFYIANGKTMRDRETGYCPPYVGTASFINDAIAQAATR